MKTAKLFVTLLLAVQAAGLASALAADWVVYQGGRGPGQGKHIVFLSGDEEYRSEEALPMLAKILAFRHGFKCTVLFAVNPTNHLIEPTVVDNIPGTEALDSADLCVMALRFRELPAEQMRHFADYLSAGKPIIGLRTSTHAFSYEKDKQGPYSKFDWRNQKWPGGFGQQVLGETWVAHHGDHGKESTRAVPADSMKDHPILRGVHEIWVPTDVYAVTHLPQDATVLMRGQVVAGMHSSDPPVEGGKNSPMMPLVWVRDYVGENGKSSKILTTTMGAAVDLQNEGLRRLLVNGCYWAVGLASEIPPQAEVAFVGDYKPTWFGFGGFKKGVKPSDLATKAE